jgi:hypothetical protein
MADISADSLISSGEFRPTNLPAGATIASGVTGTLATIPAPANGRVRLVALFAGGADQTGISIVADGVTVASARTVGQTNSITPSHLVVGVAAPVSVPYVEARTSIVISKNAGNTVASINYVAVEGI